MADYWVSFRIKDGPSYDRRYKALMAAMDDHGTGFWNSDTSMIAIRTASTIDALGASLATTLNDDTDHLVMREIGKDSTRYMGEPGDGFLSFFPNAKKL